MFFKTRKPKRIVNATNSSSGLLKTWICETKGSDRQDFLDKGTVFHRVQFCPLLRYRSTKMKRINDTKSNKEPRLNNTEVNEIKKRIRG